ncbi:hypothetical protein PR202_gb00555 [Eleusine coracana subsp. coracana]|uniref:Uncharacterized protein n=1 Tax=Eleusine coracana subsp. coracana TaxID=191504 RepID=A0AAV5DSV9_ELECO|nr:hypothetical protein PR202_gb00555 [Eleusine coracana subsp. coracana]
MVTVLSLTVAGHLELELIIGTMEASGSAPEQRRSNSLDPIIVSSGLKRVLNDIARTFDFEVLIPKSSLI